MSEASTSPVIGEVRLVRNQRSMAVRSYECPSEAITGSAMGACVIGQRAEMGVLMSS